MNRKNSLRDKIEPEDGEVDPAALLDAWVHRKLTPEDELKSILRHAYAGMESKQHRSAISLINLAADLMGPQMIVAEAALQAARMAGRAEVFNALDEQPGWDFVQNNCIKDVRKLMDKME